MKEIVEVSSEPNRPVSLPASCDSDGNVYLRPYGGGPEIALIRISHDGKSTQMSLNSDPELRRSYNLGFGVSPGGKLFELVADRKGEKYLAGFSSNGTLESKTMLETHFEGAHLTPLLGDRMFLISGTQKQEDGSSDNLTAIFDSSGRMTKRLNLPGDPKSLGIPEKKPGATTAAANAILLGSVTAGPDGRIYISRHTKPPIIYVLDSNGEMERKIKVSPPEAAMELTDMSVSSGRIAIYFRKYDQQNEVLSTIEVIDSMSGEIIGEYNPPREAGMAFACYTIDKFGFISDTKGHLAVAWIGP